MYVIDFNRKQFKPASNIRNTAVRNKEKKTILKIPT